MAEAPPGMSVLDKFSFDLSGFLIVRGVFTPEEVAQANAAIDTHQGELAERVGDALRNTKGGQPVKFLLKTFLTCGHLFDRHAALGRWENGSQGGS